MYVYSKWFTFQYLQELGWFKHYCFVNMGRHYFQLNYDVDASCDDLTPIQLVMSGGVLNGFVWQHPTTLDGSLFESVNAFALGQIVDRPPNCLYDIVNTVGVSTMHTRVGRKCNKLQNQKVQPYPTSIWVPQVRP